MSQNKKKAYFFFIILNIFTLTLNTQDIKQNQLAKESQKIESYQKSLFQQRNLLECDQNCNACSIASENCTSCKGQYRIIPSCGCQLGYYDDGSSNDCIPCDYKCGQCSYIPNVFVMLVKYLGIKHTTPVLQPSTLDPFENIGTVYRASYTVRFGNSVSYAFPILNVGETFQFCVWLRIISGWSNSDRFQLDIDDINLKQYKTDEYGNVLSSYEGVMSTVGLLELTTDWQRYCVNSYDNNISVHHFVDIGGLNNQIYEYSLPQLQKIESFYMSPLPYSVNKIADTCQECSHYTRTGQNCECSLGYQEVSEKSIECHSPKPEQCDNYIRIECSGYIPINQNIINTYANFYYNDIQIGSQSTKGINFILLDNNLQLSDQKVFNTVDTASEVIDMINFINGLQYGQIVLVATMDQASKQMTVEAYTALQTLGMSAYTTLYFRDAFAMIGKKGLQPGTAKQGIDKNKIGGKVNLVSCIRCSSICNQCIDEINEYQLIKDIYAYENPSPQLNNSLQDPFGNTGTVYEVNSVDGNSLIRFGKFQVGDSQINTIIKGQYYQFSVWIRKKSGQTINNFEMDIVDTAQKRFLSDQDGNILKVLDSSEQFLADNTLITEDWQRFVVNIYHENQDYYHFIDLGQQSGDLQYEFCHPQLFQISNIDYPPIRYIQEMSPQQNCYSCTHYARNPPLCDCSTGYTETVVGESECQALIPDTCSKYVRIESVGTNYAEYDSGDYLRIYMNDVEYDTFTRGITLIVLNETTFDKIQQTTYDSGDSSFNPQTLISDINAIPANRIVLVGIRGDGSQNLNADTYTALQSIGMNSSTQIHFRDGFAMIGKKGASSSDTIQQHSIMIKGSKANVVKCLKGCDYQCSTCSNEPHSCDTCSHSTRDINDNCNCKLQFFNVGSTAECSECDNTLCATCTDLETCIVPCHSSCKTCGSDSHCLTCNEGYFKDGNVCTPCDNSKCGTCSDIDTCIQPCDSTCLTCDISGLCITCEQSKFVDSINNNTCQDCDYKCLECQGNKSQCQTCPLNSFRDDQNNCLCEIGYYDQKNQNPICLKCEKQCKSCVSQSNQCSLCIDESRSNPPTCNCSNGYYKNDLTGDCNKCQYNCNCNELKICYECIGEDKDFRQLPTCLYCINGYFINEFGICQQCDPQCKTCIDTQSNCLNCEYGIERTLVAPKCGCQDKYYSALSINSLNLDCLICQPQCSECIDNKNCVRCTNQQFQPPYCQSEQNNIFSFSVIINGQVIETHEGICQVQCKSCQSTSSNCTACIIGRNRNNITPECDCFEGYHDNKKSQQDCQKCPKSCKTCISENECQSCFIDQNRVLNPYNFHCECQKGYTEAKNQNGQCIVCYLYKNKCFIQCPDNTYQDSTNKVCVEYKWKISQSYSFIFICGCIILIIQLLSIWIFKYFLQTNLQQNILQQKNVKFQDQKKNEDKI